MNMCVGERETKRERERVGNHEELLAISNDFM